MNTKEAFLWIIGILEKHKVVYRISGGMAARAYGSNRPLADIDIEIRDKYFKKILPDIRKYLFFIGKYRDKHFKTYGAGMKYKGQIIELSGADTEILYDSRKKKWIKSNNDLTKTTKKEIYGKTVKVIRKKDLIEYKEKLNREVDKKDLKVLYS